MSSVRCNFCGYNYYVFYAEVINIYVQLSVIHHNNIIVYLPKILSLCITGYYRASLHNNIMCVVCGWGASYLHIPSTWSISQPCGVTKLSAAVFMLDFMWQVAVVRVPILKP